MTSAFAKVATVFNFCFYFFFQDLEPLPANIDIKSIFVPPKKPLIPTKSVYNLAVTKIVHGVKELQSLSPVSLNNDEKTSLKNCVEFLQEILLDR